MFEPAKIAAHSVHHWKKKASCFPLLSLHGILIRHLSFHLDLPALSNDTSYHSKKATQSFKALVNIFILSV